MKRTQIIEAMRNIRRNGVSFLSVIIISMLAVTAYLGLSFSSEAMLRSADATFEAERFADVEISAAVPFTEEDLETVRSAEGIAEVEGILYVPSRVAGESESRDVVIRTLSERVNLPHLTEGSLPQAADECAVEKTLAAAMGYRIGDTVCLTGRSRMTDAVIKEKTYTVTGIFTIGDHLTEMVTFEPMLLVTREAFDTRLIGQDRCTRILVRAEADDPYRFSPARRESTDRLAERMEALDSRWIVVAVHNTAGYVCTKEDAGVLSTVSVTFSMMFVVIAALVIYSTIGRLVEHEGKLVGASKAMGLKNGEIFAKYLLFGAGGACIGAGLGILTAYFGFQQILLYCFRTVFLFGEWESAFQPVPVIVVTAGAAVLAFAAVFLACVRLLRSSAVSLMNGQGAGLRRRNRGSSGSGPLYIRLMARNMRTDWKRVLVSIVSVAGCCMLLMIGFSLKYAVSRVPDRQYGQIQQYDMEIAVDPSAHPQAVSAIRAVLDEEGVTYTAAYMAETPYRVGDEPGVLTLICPDDGESLADYYRITDAGSGDALEIPGSGVLVSRMFAVKYGLDAGDRFLLYDSGMDPHEAEVAGIFDNYIGINTLCGKAYAGQCFGEEIAANTLLLRMDGRDPEALRQRLSGMDGFISLASSKKQEALFDGMSAMLNLVVLLLTVLAAMIACFILLNLVNTYVSQKKNELTIMRINGYTTRETIRYASVECYVITALGILLGLAAGQAFTAFLLRLIEQLSICFVTEPIWISFVVSSVITAVISAVIHVFAFRKIRSLKLSDIQR